MDFSTVLFLDDNPRHFFQFHCTGLPHGFILPFRCLFSHIMYHTNSRPLTMLTSQALVRISPFIIESRRVVKFRSAHFNPLYCCLVTTRHTNEKSKGETTAATMRRLISSSAERGGRLFIICSPILGELVLSLEKTRIYQIQNVPNSTTRVSNLLNIELERRYLGFISQRGG